MRKHLSRVVREHLAVPNSLLLSFGGVTIALLSADPDLKLGVEGPAAKFLVRDGEPDVTVRAIFGHPAELSGAKTLFDSGTAWRLSVRNGSYCFAFISPPVGPFPYRVASFTPDFASGEVILHRDYFASRPAVYPLEYPLDELLVVNLLTRGKGVELHACGGVDAAGAGHLFVGQSGAGKTTMARLWLAAGEPQVLSDDRIIVRRAGGRFAMHGTPWHGEAMLASAASAPLAGVYFLRHAQKNEVIPLNGSEAVGCLVACSFLPFYSGDGLDFALGFLADLVQTVPCHELRFLPGGAALDLIERGSRTTAPRERPGDATA